MQFGSKAGLSWFEPRPEQIADARRSKTAGHK